MVKLQVKAKCPTCSTALSGEGGSEGLCPGCLLELALDDTGLEAEVLFEFEEAPTLQLFAQGFSEGDIHGERYRIRSLLGRGGMGEVWRAYDLKLRLDVALKALRTELIQDHHALETLRQEVRVAREVISPNVCRVFDLEELDGQELISMEYVDGTTLQEILKERGPLELNEAREIASQFLAGLEAIHDAGLAHRDIKPENLMITRTGRVVVMDFGIAKGLGDGKGGMVAGTPAYMSPEQAKGGELDARADLFSAGVVLAEMVEPGGVGNFEDRKRIWDGLHRETPQLSETPWFKVIAKAVSAETQNRYASASALARALEEVTLRAAGDETARPYPGLSAFQEEDAEFFYGRELEVEALWKKLRRPHLLAVIGPSGAGKSSFLRAGLLPTLTDGWQALITTPGNRPFANQARALAERLPSDPATVDALLRFEEPEIAIELIRQWRDKCQHALLVLDQFEELFTQNPNDAQHAFAELLGRLPLEADVHVLLSMRDDFLFHCQAFDSLAPVFSEMTPLGPPTGASLRRAIVEPALKCGYRFEDEAIVEEMLGEVEGQRGALPLLAFAAAQLWERRDRESGLLTQKAYEQIGGVGGALAQHAEAMLDYIGEANIPIVRELFRNLVTAQGTRASRVRDELLSVFPETEGEPFLEPSKVRPTPMPKPQRPAAKHVLNSLIDARLVTSYEIPADDEGGQARHHTEIVHESLLSNWPRLVRWQRQDADSAQMRDELRAQAKLWDEHGRSEDYLWTGTAFKEYALWREIYPGGLTEVEEAFGASMVRLAERQKRRRRIVVTAVIAALVVGLSIVAGFWRQAEQERLRAEAGKLLALGELEIDSHPTAALAWATKSIEVADTLEGRLLALRALQKTPPGFTLTPGEGISFQRVKFSPSGERLASNGFDQVALHFADGRESILLHDYTTEGALELPPDFAFQSEDVLVVDRNAEFRWFSLPDGREIRRVEGNRGRLHLPHRSGYLTFSSAEGETSVTWWPFGDGSSRLIGEMAETTAADVDNTGSWLSYIREGTAFLRSLENWDLEPRKIGEHSIAVNGIWIHPKGDLVAARDRSGKVSVWSAAGRSGEPHRSFETGDRNRTLSFDDVGRWLASAGMREGRPTLQLWDLAAPIDAEPLNLIKADAVWALDIDFHPTRPLIAASHGEQTSFWPLPDRSRWVLPGSQSTVGDVAFSPDGKWVLLVDDEGVRAWPLEGQDEGTSRVVFDRRLRNFSTAAFDPSGKYLAIAPKEDSGTGTAVHLVPWAGGPSRKLPGTWTGGTIFGMHFDFSPDGRLLAAVPNNGAGDLMVIRVWDLDSDEVRVLGPVGGKGGTAYFAFEDNRRLRWSGHGGAENTGSDRIFDVEDGSVEVVSEKIDESLRVVSPGGDFMFTFEEGDKWGLFRNDLQTGESRRITSHGGWLMALELDTSGEWVITGGAHGIVRVGPVSGEEPHLLFGHRGLIRAVAVSPDNHWITSAGDDGTLRLWPMPDLSKPPLHTVPHEELVAKLHSLTNLRIVEDAESPTGWTLDYAPFPGWKEIPTWP